MIKSIVFFPNSNIRLRPCARLCDAISQAKKYFNLLDSKYLACSHAYIYVSKDDIYIVTPIPFSEPGNIEVLCEDLNKIFK